MTYRPAFPNGQLATTPCGSKNCSCWAHARAVERDSKGAKIGDTGAIRRWISGTNCIPTTLEANAGAVKALYGISMAIRYGLSWADFRTLIDAGRGAVVHVGYNALHGTAFDGCPTFDGGHAIWVNERRDAEWLVLDGLADGRRAGIPYGPQWWPDALLRKAAGAFPTSGGTVGLGFVQASFTRDTEDEMDVVVTKVPLIAPNPRPLVFKVTANAFDYHKPNTVVATYTVGTAAQATARVALEWISPRPQYPDDSNQGLFLLLTDGRLVVETNVTLAPDTPVAGDAPAAYAKGKADQKAADLAAVQAA